MKQTKTTLKVTVPENGVTTAEQCRDPETISPIP